MIISKITGKVIREKANVYETDDFINEIKLKYNLPNVDTLQLKTAVSFLSKTEIVLWAGSTFAKKISIFKFFI